MEEERLQLLRLAVDIGDGRKDTIVVYQNDNPEDLAKDFCLKHELDFTIIETLKNLIVTNLRNSQTQDEVPKQNQRERNSDQNAKEDFINSWKKSLQKDLLKSIENKPKICERSRKIASCHINPGESVFDRLHRKSIEIQKSKASREITNSLSIMQSEKPTTLVSQYALKRAEATQPYNNLGHRLYHKGVKMIEESNRKLSNMKKQQISEENKNLTFTPRIDKNSKKAIQRNKTSIEDYLIEKGIEKQKEKESKTKQFIDEQMKQYTYTPTLS